MNPKNQLLLIEDERNICNFIMTILKSNDYKMTYALNAETGVRI